MTTFQEICPVNLLTLWKDDSPEALYLTYNYKTNSIYLSEPTSQHDYRSESILGYYSVEKYEGKVVIELNIRHSGIPMGLEDGVYDLWDEAESRLIANVRK